MLPEILALLEGVATNPEFEQAALQGVVGLANLFLQHANNPAKITSLAKTITDKASVVVGAIAKNTAAATQAPASVQAFDRNTAASG